MKWSIDHFKSESEIFGKLTIIKSRGPIGLLENVNKLRHNQARAQTAFGLPISFVDAKCHTFWYFRLTWELIIPAHKYQEDD